MTTDKVLIACVGNQLIADDGVGIGVAKSLWNRDLPAGVCVEEYGIGGIHMVQRLMEGDITGLIIVDCADRGRPPGTVMVIEPDVINVLDLPEVDRYDYLADMHLATPERALALIQALDLMPEHLILIGIQPHTVDEIRQKLSVEVEQAVDIAADEALRIAAEMQTATAS